MHDFADKPGDYPSPQPLPPPRGLHPVWWLLGCATVLGVLVCGGGLSFVAFIGAYGPDTSVYTGNRVPSHFVRIAKDVGALEENERIVYFYSDTLYDIRQGFYFVSDKKLAIYIAAVEDEPLTIVNFDDVASIELYRDESFFEDSEISIELHDGQVLSFPVSSEFDRDVEFYEAIRERCPNLVESQATEADSLPDGF